jgi:hypothetical protein
MATSKKPRKPYVRRWSAGHMLLPQQRDAIAMPVHAALMAFEFGGGTVTLRHTIAAFLNITSMLSKRMQSADETPEIVELAMHSLVASDRRFMATGKWGFSGPEMIAMRAAVAVGDMLIKRANTTVLYAVVDRVSYLNSMTPEVMGTVKEPLAA